MPVYRFCCCGNEVEAIQGIDKDTLKCPKCGAKMKKLPTFPAVIKMKADGIRDYPQGYKEGYAKEYRRRLEA